MGNRAGTSILSGCAGDTCSLPPPDFGSLWTGGRQKRGPSESTGRVSSGQPPPPVLLVVVCFYNTPGPGKLGMYMRLCMAGLA